MVDNKGLIQYLIENGRGGHSWEEIGKMFRKSAEAARTAWKNYRKVSSMIGEKQEAHTYIKDLENKILILDEDLKSGTGELKGIVDEPIRSLEDLIFRCNIDVNVWRIDKYIQNVWGDASSPKWQVKAFMSKRTVDNDLQKQKELILEEMRKESKPSLFFVMNLSPDTTLLEISLPDLHIGKLAWDKESGKDYDIDIAISRFKEAVKELLSRVNLEKIDRIHLPLGNDAIHVDNADNTTTKGTPVDTDGRFPKIIRAAKKLFIEVIDELALIAPVDVTIVSGNHDTSTMFMLGEVLDAWYHNNVAVKVNNSPKSRKFYQYGKCGFMYTHGDKEKHNELGQIFAHEEKDLWAATDYRFCKLGHTHKNKKMNFVTIDTFIGFQVQILPSLSHSDEWHYSNGYLSNTQGKAFLYHREKGEIGEFTCTI